MDHRPPRDPRLDSLTIEQTARIIVAEHLLGMGLMTMDQAVAYAREKAGRPWARERPAGTARQDVAAEGDTAPGPVTAPVTCPPDCPCCYLHAGTCDECGAWRCCGHCEDVTHVTGG